MYKLLIIYSLSLHIPSRQRSFGYYVIAHGICGYVGDMAAFGLSPMMWYPVIILIAETAVWRIIAAYFTRWREV